MHGLTHIIISLRRHIVRAMIVGLTIATMQTGQAAAESVMVFAAASLKDTLEAAARAYHAAGQGDVTFSFAATSILAKQIEYGGRADMFASADVQWMDYLAQKDLIRPTTRVNLLGNQLVLIAPASAAISNVALTRDAIATALGTSRLATGECNTVPVGIYAKAALQSLDLWSELEPKLAQADNVRSALAFVARGEAALGIVYATDAHADATVKIVAKFPASSHDPIVYPFAITRDSHNPDAEKFLTFLQSDTARKIFEDAGFAVLSRE